MADWTSLAPSRTLDVPGFQFDSGERLDLRLHCRVLGRPTAAQDNVVLMLHGTTASGKQFLQPESADPLFGSGCPLDISRYCMLLPDAINHGESSKPSDGLGADFPNYGYGDMVRAQHLLVTGCFGLSRLRLVMGPAWAACRPGCGAKPIPT